MKKVDPGMPVLFSRNERKSKKAYHALKEAGIPFKNVSSADNNPILVVDNTYHIGFLEIEKFIKSEEAQEIKEKYKSLFNK